MKYAFIIGSNAFVVPSKVLSYADDVDEKEFLRINSIYHDLPPGAKEAHLDIDLDIKDIDGTPILMLANQTLNSISYTVKRERNSIQVLRADGSLIIHVHQLDDESAMSLEHNITAELEVNMPIVVIRINGDFMAGGLRITAENEKLYVNDIVYANSVLAGKNQLHFTTNGVVL
jgi:hypothetical protein